MMFYGYVCASVVAAPVIVAKEERRYCWEIVTVRINLLLKFVIFGDDILCKVNAIVMPGLAPRGGGFPRGRRVVKAEGRGRALRC